LKSGGFVASESKDRPTGHADGLLKIRCAKQKQVILREAELKQPVETAEILLSRRPSYRSAHA